MQSNDWYTCAGAVSVARVERRSEGMSLPPARCHPFGRLERGEVHVAISTAGAIQASNYSFETIRLPSLGSVTILWGGNGARGPLSTLVFSSIPEWSAGRAD